MVKAVNIDLTDTVIHVQTVFRQILPLSNNYVISIAGALLA